MPGFICLYLRSSAAICGWISRRLTLINADQDKNKQYKRAPGACSQPGFRKPPTSLGFCSDYELSSALVSRSPYHSHASPSFYARFYLRLSAFICGYLRLGFPFIIKGQPFELRLDSKVQKQAHFDLGGT